MPKIVKQEPTARKESGVMGRVKADVATDIPLKCCFYGKSGSGKTSLAGTFPKPLLRIRSPNEANRKSIVIKGADVVDPRSLAELKEIAKYQQAQEKYATVVIDNVTDFQDMAIKEVLGVDEIPAQLGWGTVTQQQYGETTLYMKEMLRDYIAELNCHVVLITQEREFNNDNTTSDILSPYVGCALSPSLAGWVGPSVDFLCQTFLRIGTQTITKKVGGKDVTLTKEGGVEFCLRTGAHPTYITKFTVDRGVTVPEIIVNPTHASLMAIINGKQV